MEETPIVQDLDILSKYLSKEELKEIAKQAAYDKFSSYLGKDNPNRRSNYDYYIKYGALESVREHMKDFDVQKLTKQLENKVRDIIKNMQSYHLPDEYKEIAKQYMLDNKNIITSKIDNLLKDFVNSEGYQSCHSSFKDYVGEVFSEILYTMLEDRFKSKNN